MTMKKLSSVRKDKSKTILKEMKLSGLFLNSWDTI